HKPRDNTTFNNFFNRRISLFGQDFSKFCGRHKLVSDIIGEYTRDHLGELLQDLSYQPLKKKTIFALISMRRRALTLRFKSPLSSSDSLVSPEMPSHSIAFVSKFRLF